MCRASPAQFCEFVIRVLSPCYPAPFSTPHPPPPSREYQLRELEGVTGADLISKRGPDRAGGEEERDRTNHALNGGGWREGTSVGINRHENLLTRKLRDFGLNFPDCLFQSITTLLNRLGVEPHRKPVDLAHDLFLLLAEGPQYD